jgi:hypothetical protein
MILKIDASLIEAFAKLAWPFIVLIIIVVFGPRIYRIMKLATEVKFEFGGSKFAVSQHLDEVLIRPLQDELDEAIYALTGEQKRLFREIYKRIEGDRTRYYVPADFIRSGENKEETQQLKNFRALRDVNFIRPILGGRWEAGKEIQLKNFGKLAAKMKGAELGFLKKTEEE